MPRRVDIPDRVRSLIDRAAPSIEHVEVLIAMRGDREHGWSLEELGAHGSAGVTELRRCVGELVAAGVVEEREPGCYALPRLAEVRGTIDALARLYNERPLVIAQAIAERPARSAVLFADAFRIRPRRR